MPGAVSRFRSPAWPIVLSATVLVFYKPSNVTTVIRWMVKEAARGLLLDGVAVCLSNTNLPAGDPGGEICHFTANLSPAEPTSWWRSGNTASGKLKCQHAMLQMVRATRPRHGKPRYVRVPRPHAVVASSARHHIRDPADHGVDLFARLASSRSAFLKPDPRWRLASFVSDFVQCGLPRVSSCYPQSSVLTIHMMKHLLLMTAAAPLILAGAPVFTLACGLPKLFIKSHPSFSGFYVALWLNRFLMHSESCHWLASTAAVIGWHLPAAVSVGHALSMGA